GLQNEANPYYNKDVNKNITKIIKDFLNIDYDKLGYKDFYDLEI
ncbi:UDP-N-acetylglucosamine 2-epimerase (hydrolyzing), partial [Salmonella enterica]|nr:UDP-N-acetylglucosamine 2-epimerase (hydrolyzing) [Salmonella enterica]